MPKSTREHIGKVFSFLKLDKNEDFSDSSNKKSLLIPFAQSRISGFNIMIIGSRPSNGRTLFLNELLIANTIFRSTGNSFESPEPCRSLAYFLTENPVNYFNKLIPGILGINQETLRWNSRFRESTEFQSNILDLDATLPRRPLFLEFSLPAGIDKFRTAIESDIKSCNPDFIFIDGLEVLAQPEKLEYDYHGTRNIDVWLDACLELNRKRSIPFVITRLLNPQNDRAFDLFQPVFSDFNSSTIDSACDIVVSMLRPALYGIQDESDRNNQEKTVQFLVQRDRTGMISGKYKCEIESEIPRMVFPEKNCLLSAMSRC
jgi:hypothetical protein